MDIDRFEKNLTDVIKEAQLKLGYDGNAARFNYPVSSLAALTGVRSDTDSVSDMLNEFAEKVSPRLGRVTFTEKDGIFTLCVPSEGTRYVHENTGDGEFIARIIDAVRSHASMEEILDIFRAQSENVHIESTDNGEFDYLVYFPDGVPDDYRYCLADEGMHVSYHRFTPEDYESFGF